MTIEEFHLAVDRWHEADTDLTVYEWLGMDEKTYASYLEDTCFPPEQIILSAEDYAAMEKELANPSPPNQALKDLLKRTNR